MIEITLGFPEGIMLGVEWARLYKLNRSGKTLYANPDAPLAGYILKFHFLLGVLSCVYTS